MQELLSYRLSDLLLFSEQSFLRQFELYNQWLYPFQWLIYLYGALFFVSLFKSSKYFTRVLFLFSAVLWLVCAYGYLWQYYLAINWMIEYFIVLFIVQALLISRAGFKLNSPGIQVHHSLISIAGLLLWISTLVAQPVFELLAGRHWNQLSAFALTPDSLSYIAVASMLIFRLPGWYFLPAALWLLFSTLTYIAMDSMTFLFPAFALSIYVLSLFLRKPLTG